MLNFYEYVYPQRTMKRVLVNPDMISRLTWNIGYGNKILHLLFTINLAAKNNADFQTPPIKILDDFFNLEAYKTNNLKGDRIYTEVTALEENRLTKLVYKWFSINLNAFSTKQLQFSIDSSQRQYEYGFAFLNSKIQNTSFFVAGHFWHYDLMPNKAVFDNFIILNEHHLKEIRNKYPDIENENHVAVHLRDTDFKTHLRTIFNKGICLPNSYYEKAIMLAEEKLGVNVVFHLFSDNMERLKNVFKGKNHIIHRDSAHLDWLSIFLSKNVIQSNSSFCWTASLFKTGLSIQPKSGYNWARPIEGSVPYGFEMPFSSIINCSENQETSMTFK
ncbi:MAG: hypothetical protein ACI9YE_001965 [Psychroserpens sp.]|jgi:hypothetical protein